MSRYIAGWGFAQRFAQGASRQLRLNKQGASPSASRKVLRTISPSICDPSNCCVLSAVLLLVQLLRTAQSVSAVCCMHVIFDSHNADISQKATQEVAGSSNTHSSKCSILVLPSNGPASKRCEVKMMGSCGIQVGSGS